MWEGVSERDLQQAWERSKMRLYKYNYCRWREISGDPQTVHFWYFVCGHICMYVRVMVYGECKCQSILVSHATMNQVICAFLVLCVCI